MSNRPAPGDAAPWSLRYIDLIPGHDPLDAMAAQLDEATAFLAGISDERSLHRYAPGKWSIREVLGHITDTERIFAFRALWFARDLPSPVPGFDQDTAVPAQQAHRLSWATLIAEFRTTRRATLDLFRNLPPDAFPRRGIASDQPFTVLAFAYIIPGHTAYHLNLLRDRYL